MAKETNNQTPMIKRLSWIVWGLLAVLVFLLASAFIRAWATNQALQEDLEMLEPMLTTAAQDQATLYAELTRVQSDAYVEQWAREHAGMVLPHETLVIPVIPTATATPTPSPTPIPTPTPTPVPFWKTWWRSISRK